MSTSGSVEQRKLLQMLFSPQLISLGGVFRDLITVKDHKAPVPTTILDSPCVIIRLGFINFVHGTLRNFLHTINVDFWILHNISGVFSSSDYANPSMSARFSNFSSFKSLPTSSSLKDLPSNKGK